MAWPFLECEEASDKIQDGDEVAIDFDTGIITNVTRNETYQALPFPDFTKKSLPKWRSAQFHSLSTKEKGKCPMKYNIAVIHGDGIGPEVVGEALKVLDTIAAKYHHDLFIPLYWQADVPLTP